MFQEQLYMILLALGCSNCLSGYKLISLNFLSDKKSNNMVNNNLPVLPDYQNYQIIHITNSNDLLNYIYCRVNEYVVFSSLSQSCGKCFLLSLKYCS